MSKILQSLFLCTVFAAAGTAYAQETTTEDQDTATENSATEDPTPADLSMGVEVTEEGEVAVGTPYLANTTGDWQLRCLNTPDDQPDPCQLYQLLRDDTGNEVAEFSMFPLPAGGRAAAGATIVVPLETLLTEQLTLSVDGGATRRYPFTFCNTAGCVARVGFTTEEVNQFKRGNAGQIRLVPAGAPDEEVLLTVSLTGFTAGYEAAEAALQ